MRTTTIITVIQIASLETNGKRKTPPITPSPRHLLKGIHLLAKTIKLHWVDTGIGGKYWRIHADGENAGKEIRTFFIPQNTIVEKKTDGETELYLNGTQITLTGNGNGPMLVTVKKIIPLPEAT